MNAYIYFQHFFCAFNIIWNYLLSHLFVIVLTVLVLSFDPISQSLSRLSNKNTEKYKDMKDKTFVHP